MNQLPTAFALLCCMISTAGLAAAPVSSTVSSAVSSTDKGNFKYSEPQPWPEQLLDLAPINTQVAEAAKSLCATAAAGESIQLGDTQSILNALGGGGGGGAANAVGKLVGGLLGTPGGRKRPKLAKDPIKKKHKHKFEHPTGSAHIRIGGVQQPEQLVISARIDKARGKGTFHSIFLERPDCLRIWPEQYEGYGLWGTWSLSVSVTKTKSQYKNGKLVDRQVDQSNWNRHGDLDFGQGFSVLNLQPNGMPQLLLDPSQAFLAQLQQESASPAWHALGYGQPVQGIRTVGARFLVTAADLPSGTTAVVHITDIGKTGYRTLGFPLRMKPTTTGPMQFEQLSLRQE